MKLTGAYGGASLNIKREDSLKKLGKLEKGSKNFANTKAEFTGVDKFEALTAQTLEQSKYYQTKISQLQNAKESLGYLKEVIDSNGNEDDIQQLKAEIERVLNNSGFSENEQLSDLTLEGLGFNKDIPDAKVKDIVREILLKVEVKEKGFDSKIQSYEEEIMKINLATENIRAAISQIKDNDELKEALSTVKSGLEDLGIDIQNKTSQARVLKLIK